MVFAFAEATVFVKRGSGAKHLATIFALDLCPTVCMHALVPAQVRELGVGLVAHLTCIQSNTRHKGRGGQIIT